MCLLLQLPKANRSIEFKYLGVPAKSGQAFTPIFTPLRCVKDLRSILHAGLFTSFEVNVHRLVIRA